MRFLWAPDVRDLARRLMEEGQPHNGLLNAVGTYLFTDKVPVTGDKEIWGRADVVTGRNAKLANVPSNSGDGYATEFFCVTITYPIWERLSEAHRTALVDHELCHLMVDEKGKLVKLSHDVEEFSGVVRRHGLWRQSLVEFWAAKDGQTEFVFEGDDGEEGGEGDNGLPLAGLRVLSGGQAALPAPQQAVESG